MKVEIKLDGDLEAGLAAEIASAERAVTAGVRQTAEALKAAWRGQVKGSGLGQRLANSIRARHYPEKGESIGAASIVFSKAPKIVDAFERGALIRAAGGIYLAIPTAEAGMKGLGDERITPKGWQQRTGRELRFVARPGRHPLLVADDMRLDRRGLAREIRRRRRRDGILTGAQTIPIFVLVPQVRLRKRLDLERAARDAEASLPAAILRAWKD